MHWPAPRRSQIRWYCRTTARRHWNLRLCKGATACCCCCAVTLSVKTAKPPTSPSLSSWAHCYSRTSRQSKRLVTAYASPRRAWGVSRYFRAAANLHEKVCQAADAATALPTPGLLGAVFGGNGAEALDAEHHLMPSTCRIEQAIYGFSQFPCRGRLPQDGRCTGSQSQTGQACGLFR